MYFSFDLTGKKAIITGGAGEIGFAIAETLCAHGADVALIDVSQQTDEKACELKRKSDGKAYAVVADLKDRESIRSGFQACLADIGGVDILVNAAGIIRREDAEYYTERDWDDTLAVNLTATYLFSQLAARVMLKKGAGRIINIASMNCFDGGRRICAYAASKGAVALFTKSCSNEWAGKGINVNAIAPGYIATQINTFYRTPEGAEQNRIITERIPCGRWGKPGDICGAALFLASSAADYISGIIMPVDGGYQGN